MRPRSAKNPWQDRRREDCSIAGVRRIPSSRIMYATTTAADLERPAWQWTLWLGFNGINHEVVINHEVESTRLYVYKQGPSRAVMRES
jgi:hypothetical protein